MASDIEITVYNPNTDKSVSFKVTERNIKDQVQMAIFWRKLINKLGI